MHTRVLLCALAAAILAAATDGAPDRYALVRLAPPLRDESAPTSANAIGGLNDDVILVPLEAPPLAVRDIEEEEDHREEEDEGGAVAALSRLLGLQDGPAARDSATPFDGSPLRFFSSLQSLQPPPPPLTPLPFADDGGAEMDLDGGRVVVLRVGRGLKSLDSDDGEMRESRVLEDDLGADRVADDQEDDAADLDEDIGLRREHLRTRRALRLVVRQAAGPAADEVTDDAPQGRAGTTPAPSGSFLETVQNQLPGQLQGLGGAMEDSRMIVGSFQAIIMPGSAATDLGQQIQGFISNMPQMPQLPGGTG